MRADLTNPRRAQTKILSLSILSSYIPEGNTRPLSRKTHNMLRFLLRRKDPNVNVTGTSGTKRQGSDTLY